MTPGPSSRWVLRSPRRAHPTDQRGVIPARVAFSPDGTRLAVAGDTVEFFDVATRRRVGASVPLGSPAATVSFSPDGKTLAVGGTQGDLYLVDVPSGRRRGPLPGLSPSGVRYQRGVQPRRAPPGRNDPVGQAVVYDHLRRAAPRPAPLPGNPNNVSAARFSPDGSLLATGSLDGTLRLRDGRTLRPLGPSILTNQALIVGIGFSP